MKALCILAVLHCMSVALAIKCNYCSSTTSMEDCKDKESLQNCGILYDTCVKWSYEYKIVGGFQYKDFHKGCYTETLCSIHKDSRLKTCKESGGETCQLDCCDTDGCNGGSAPVFSVFLISACALVVVLFR